MQIHLMFYRAQNFWVCYSQSYLKKWINVGKFWDYLMTSENYILEYTHSSLGNSKIGKRNSYRFGRRYYYRFICGWLCINFHLTLSKVGQITCWKSRHKRFIFLRVWFCLLQISIHIDEFLSSKCFKYWLNIDVWSNQLKLA